MDNILATYEKSNNFIIKVHKQIAIEKFNYQKNELYKLRDKLIVSFEKQSVKIKIPLGIVLIVPRTTLTSESDNSDCSDTDNARPLPALEFFNMAAKMLPDFDRHPIIQKKLLRQHLY